MLTRRPDCTLKSNKDWCRLRSSWRQWKSCRACALSEHFPSKTARTCLATTINIKHVDEDLDSCGSPYLLVHADYKLMPLAIFLPE